MKRLIAIFAGIVIALMFTSAAFADQPARNFLPAGDFTLEDVCPFDVGVEIIENKEFITTFSGGRQLITGTFKVRVTNLDSDESLDLNISGPGVLVFNPDGSLTVDAHGTWLLWFFPGNLGPSSPGQLFVNNGHFVETIGPGGISIDKQTGSQQDICAALA